MLTPDALIVGLGKPGGSDMHLFTVRRERIPDRVRRFLEIHQDLLTDRPGDYPDDPARHAYRYLKSSLDMENPALDVDAETAAAAACLFFLGLSTDPRAMKGPTLVQVTDDGVYYKPMDVDAILANAKRTLH